MKELNEYPNGIFLATQSVAQIDREIAELKIVMSREESMADRGIVLDTSLKNEGQRQAKKFDLLSDNWRESEVELIAMRHDRAMYAATLQQLENEFKVAVLEMRLKIGQLPIVE